MRQLPLLAAALLLAACTPATKVTTLQGYRMQSAPVTSTTRFDAARFGGTWHVAARFAPANSPAAALPESYVFTPTGPDSYSVTRTFPACTPAGCTPKTETQTARITTPGRITMAHNGRTSPHWVHWVDDDYRTAAIGTPDGTFGWIMTRGTPRADLVHAASEILEWQGYTMPKLVKVKQ